MNGRQMIKKNGVANDRKIGRQMSQNMGRQMNERQLLHNPFGAIWMHKNSHI